MNISTINNYQTTISMTKNIDKNKITYSYKSKDSFCRQSPAFRGGIQSGAEFMSKHPEFLKMFGEYMSAGFLAFMGLKIAENKINNESDIQEDVSLKMKQIYEEQIKDLMQKNQDLEQQLQEKNQELQMMTISSVKDDNSEQPVKVNFPKKMGRLTTEQEELKKTILNLPPISKEYADRLENICSDLIHTAPENKEQKKQIIKNLNEELQETNRDQGKISVVIDKFLNNEKNEAQTSSEAEEVTNFETEEANENQEVDNIYRTAPILQNPKVVGKIDLNTENKRKRFKITPEITPTKVRDTKLYEIKIPNTTRNIQDRIKTLFGETIKIQKELSGNDSFSLLRRTPIIKANASDVKKEIQKQASRNEPFKNITVDDSEEIAQLLSTGKFQHLFSMHSAMRFIDRYIDLDSDIPLEKQCDRKIRALEQAIAESFKTGLKFKPYKIEQTEKKMIGKNEYEEVTKTYYASKIYIYPTKLSKEIEDQLGTLRIEITFAKPKHNNTDSQGVIVTMFSPGV